MNYRPNAISYNVMDMVFRSWLCTDRCFTEAGSAYPLKLATALR